MGLPERVSRCRAALGWAKLALTVGLMAQAGSAPGLADTFDVTTTSDVIDNNPGDGSCLGGSPFMACSLRAAIMEANALAGNDTIRLLAKHYRLTRAGVDEDFALTGDLDVFEGTTVVEGKGATATVIDAQGLDRVFDVHDAASLVLKKVTITGGLALLPGISGTSGFGGGVRTDDGTSLSVHESVVEGNRAHYGGGINFGGVSLDLRDSTVTNNVAQSRKRDGTGSALAQGGGVVANNPGFGSPGGQVIVAGSSITLNRCEGQSCIERGSGLFAIGCGNAINPTLLLSNSTISGNSPEGVWLLDCGAEILYSTIVNHPGGGLSFEESSAPTQILRVYNSIVAQNSPDCDVVSGTFPATWDVAGNHNLDSDGTCGLNFALGDHPSTDPMLYPLGYFAPPSGRVAESHHPKWGSPVVDEGMPLAPPGESELPDQDDWPRPLDGDKSGAAEVDMGSIEVLPCSAPVDVILENVLLSDQAVQACNTITTGGTYTHVQGSWVTFLARDSIAIGNGFAVAEGSTFGAHVVRHAGTPP